MPAVRMGLTSNFKIVKHEHMPLSPHGDQLVYIEVLNDFQWDESKKEEIITAIYTILKPYFKAQKEMMDYAKYCWDQNGMEGRFGINIWYDEVQHDRGLDSWFVFTNRDWEL